MDDPPPAAEVELLELGAQRDGPSRRFWLRAGAATLIVAVVLAAGSLATRRRAAADPTFTQAEVAQVYASPLSGPPGTPEWDPSTRLVQGGGHDVTSTDVEPTECAVVVDSDAPPVSVDLVSVSLIPLSRPDGGQVFSGIVVSYRYARPAAARAKYTLLSDLLARCSAFRDGGNSVTVERLATDSADRSPSDLSFRLNGSAGPLHVNVLRFGNTVTWITTADPVDPGHGRVPDLLVARMRAEYRAR